MPISFPLPPNNDGDEYTYDGVTWVYSSAKNAWSKQLITLETLGGASQGDLAAEVSRAQSAESALAGQVTTNSVSGALSGVSSDTAISDTDVVLITDSTKATYKWVAWLTGIAEKLKSAFMALSGDQTVGGVKNFTSTPTISGNAIAIVSDPVRTTVTGNGVTTAFAISGATGLINPSALIVAIDGALQEPVADYTVASSTITFTSPVPNGSKAVIVSPVNSLQVSQAIPADGSVTTAKLDNSLTVQNLNVAASLSSTGDIVGSGTGNRLPNQLVSGGDYIITRNAMDSVLCDPDLIYFRDDFISVTDGLSTMIGELGWTAFSPIGTGSIRPLNIANASFGIVGLHTGAVFRGSTIMTWDVSNIIGGGGILFSSNGLENSSTVVKFRFQFDNLTSSVGAGFGVYASTVYKQNRFFGLRYSKPASAWTPSTAITLNDYRRPTVANGRRYYASVGGTTGGSEPTWPTTAGGTVVDGSVTWTENGLDGNTNLVLQNCPNTADEYTSTIVDTGVTAAINTWYNVVMTHVSGSTWNFTINGVNVGNITMSSNNRGFAILPVFKIEAAAATAMSLSVDYFIFFSRGITR